MIEKMLIKLIKNEKGSISLFVIIIITALFFLNILLIDFARIMTGKFISEKSLKAAIRSELSEFDQSIYNKYGLFGYLESKDGIFEEVLIKNLDNGNKGFNYLKFDTDNIKYELTFEQEIILLPVFKNQILEEMKYKAPIKFQQKIFNKLKEPVEHISDSMENYDFSQEVTAKFLTRNNKLLEVFDLQIVANKLVPVNTSEVILRTVDKVNMIINAELDEDGIQKIRNEISNDANLLSVAYHKNYTAFFATIEEAKRQLVDSEQLNVEITNMLNRYDESIDYNDTILTENIYDEIIKSVSLQENLFNDLSNGLNEVCKNINLFNSGSVSCSELIQSLELFEILFNQYNTQFYNLEHTDNSISCNMKKFNNATASINRYYDEFLQESENSLFSLDELIKSFKLIISTDEVAEFINDKYLEFLLFNQKSIQTKSSDVNLNVENINSEITGIFARIKPIIDNYLIEIRDLIYYQEYAFENFNSLEDKLSEDNFEMIMSGNLNEDFASSIHISQQELEYIIYGNGNSSANIASALRDIYVIRFLFNIFDAFLNPAIFSSTNPIVVMLEAGAYSFKESISDLALIIKGNDVPLMKKISVGSFGYVEYLKILYLSRGFEDELLLRQLALIENATGKDLQSVKTYGVADVEIAMDLWFLPQLTSVKSLDAGLIETYFKDNYVIKRGAAYGY